MVVDLLIRAGGVAAWMVQNTDQWTWQHFGAWCVLIVAALETVSQLVLGVGRLAGYDRDAVRIVTRGRPLERLEARDYVFIWMNKITTGFFIYQMLGFCWRD